MIESYCKKAEEPKVVILTYKREQLLYDIQNYAFVEGDVMPEDLESARVQVFDVAEDGNIDRVSRVLNLAHAECEEMLYPYSKNELEGNEEEELNNVLTAPEEYKIKLLLPRTFSRTTLNLVNHLVHEYMVYRVIGDWLSITYPQSQLKWDAKLGYVRDKIRTSLVARVSAVTRKVSPF